MAIRKQVISLAALLVIPNAMTAQALPDPISGSGGVSASDFEWQGNADSLHIRLINYQIHQAEVEKRRTNLWHRLIPEVRISGNLGVRDILFVDPATATPYILPKDAYRLTIGLSLSEVFNFDKHTLASLQYERLLVQREIVLHRFKKGEEASSHQQEKLRVELAKLQEESLLISQLAEYTELLFNQGEKQFDELIRIRLQQLNIRKAMTLLELQLKQSTRDY